MVVSCPPPSGLLLRNVQIRSRRICPTGRVFSDKQQINKRLSLPTEPFVLFDVWQFPTLAWGDPTLPSALRRFTSEFGMGSGGTTALLPPDKFFSNLPNFNLKSGADTQSRTGDPYQGCALPTEPYQHAKFDAWAVPYSHGETPHYHRHCAFRF